MYRIFLYGIGLYYIYDFMDFLKITTLKFFKKQSCEIILDSYQYYIILYLWSSLQFWCGILCTNFFKKTKSWNVTLCYVISNYYITPFSSFYHSNSAVPELICKGKWNSGPLGLPDQDSNSSSFAGRVSYRSNQSSRPSR